YRIACLTRFLGAPVVHVRTVYAVAPPPPSPGLDGRLFVDKLLSVWCDELIAADDKIVSALLDRLIRISKIRQVGYVSEIYDVYVKGLRA
ncbi:MAG: hypothetical protein LBU58_11200, partial [Clostridiales bacterium]|nr:hypothetical protein [Clostridiales bacterium]